MAASLRGKCFSLTIVMNKDSIDQQLVKLLGQDARQSAEQLAKKLNINAATVRRKIKRLIQNGSLHIVGVVDPAHFGLPLGAVITLGVVPNKLESTLEEINEQPEIKWVVTTTGPYDIIAGARFSSLDAISEFNSEVLAKLEGINNSEMFIILNTRKGYVQLT
jgi:DNA-binding Lrp family transcriptional regulator